MGLIKDNDYIFSVARVRANENRLLDETFFDSLIKTEEYNTALKMLSEKGYSDLESNEEYVYEQRIKDAYQIALSPFSNKQPLDFLLLKNDFHNIKVVFKTMYDSFCSEGLFVLPSVVDPSVMKQTVINKTFNSLPCFFAEIVKESYDIYQKTSDMQKLETFLDKKCLEYFYILSNETKNKNICEYAELKIKLVNLKTALRSKKLGFDEHHTRDMLVNTNNGEVEKLCMSVFGSDEMLDIYVKSLGIGKNYESKIEKYCDDILVEYIKKAKYVSFGLFPIMAYCLAVETEISNIKTVLQAKRIGLGQRETKERLRKLYV